MDKKYETPTALLLDINKQQQEKIKKLRDALEEIGYELYDECPSSVKTALKITKKALEE